MKKGMILYVAEGKGDVPLQREEDLVQVTRSLGVTTVCVATTEEDAVDGWWKLIAKGMHQVLFMTVAYDSMSGNFQFLGTPSRIWG
jgi:hypothetical protein